MHYNTNSNNKKKKNRNKTECGICYASPACTTNSYWKSFITSAIPLLNSISTHSTVLYYSSILSASYCTVCSSMCARQVVHCYDLISFFGFCKYMLFRGSNVFQTCCDKGHERAGKVVSLSMMSRLQIKTGTGAKMWCDKWKQRTQSQSE